MDVIAYFCLYTDKYRSTQIRLPVLDMFGGTANIEQGRINVNDLIMT